MNTSFIGSSYVVHLEGVTELMQIPSMQSEIAANTESMRQYLNGRYVSLSMTLNQVLDVLRNGTPAGIEKLERFAEQFKALLPMPKSYRRKQRWSDEGDEPSWEREQSGHEAIWRTSRRETQRGPATVELASPWGGNGLPDFTWDGIVVVTLTNLLELAGYRVGSSLNKCNTVYGSDASTCVTRIELKQPDQPMDISSIASVVTCGSVYEVLGRASIKLHPVRVGSFGTNIEVTELPQATRDALFRPGTVFLRHTYSRTDAIEEIHRVLQLFA